MAGSQINLVEEIKVLGLIIDTRLNFRSHVAAVCKSLSKSTSDSLQRKSNMGSEQRNNKDHIHSSDRTHHDVRIEHMGSGDRVRNDQIGSKLASKRFCHQDL
ncbi:hypothetical protein EVAR_84217_1 [Eumeta japonica]|uniref:Uncharacterized protein n=1 Tax=Eumeta variegata TaxID=151549 RepID=A0A4C1WUL5_EUMVA|nr:hypothetical protein EVAR_84217_1 [Eumeta japonica]